MDRKSENRDTERSYRTEQQKPTSCVHLPSYLASARAWGWGVRWEREEKNSGISLENAVTAWKEKKSHWQHGEEIIPNKRKTRKKRKNCTALQRYKSSECSIPLRYTMIIVMMMITTSFAGNSTIKNT